MPRILITRSPHQASELAQAVRALGGEPVLVPAIELVAPASFAVLDDALGRLGDFAWVVFTSANAVEVFARRWGGVGAGWKVAAIGPATARAAEAAGLRVDLVPPLAVAESLAEAMVPLVSPGTKVLLVRAQEGREVLPDVLRAAGAEVSVAAAYRTVVPDGSVEALRGLFANRETWPDAVTFTSSSTVRNLMALLKAAGIDLPREVVRASIGPVTSATLREAGYPPHVEAGAASVESLASATMQYLLDVSAASA